MRLSRATLTRTLPSVLHCPVTFSNHISGGRAMMVPIVTYN
jgi:hypothetical protein